MFNCCFSDTCGIKDTFETLGDLLLSIERKACGYKVITSLDKEQNDRIKKVHSCALVVFLCVLLIPLIAPISLIGVISLLCSETRRKKLQTLRQLSQPVLLIDPLLVDGSSPKPIQSSSPQSPDQGVCSEPSVSQALKPRATPTVVVESSPSQASLLSVPESSAVPKASDHRLARVNDEERQKARKRKMTILTGAIHLATSENSVTSTKVSEIFKQKLDLITQNYQKSLPYDENESIACWFHATGSRQPSVGDKMNLMGKIVESGVLKQGDGRMDKGVYISPRPEIEKFGPIVFGFDDDEIENLNGEFGLADKDNYKPRIWACVRTEMALSKVSVVGVKEEEREEFVKHFPNLSFIPLPVLKKMATLYWKAAREKRLDRIPSELLTSLWKKPEVTTAQEWIREFQGKDRI